MWCSQQQYTRNTSTDSGKLFREKENSLENGAVVATKCQRSVADASFLFSCVLKALLRKGKASELINQRGLTFIRFHGVI